MKEEKSVRFQQESPSAFPAKKCPFSARIRVRFAQELLSVFSRKVCPFSAGKCVRFGQEYAQFGESHGIRDKSALESAISRPFTTFDLQEMYPSPIEKAAAILESVVTNHPFIDGNKRIGYVLARLLIMKSGLDIHTTQQDKYDLVIGVSKGELKFDQIKAWLYKRCK